jgi:hypothetical protein
MSNEGIQLANSANRWSRKNVFLGILVCFLAIYINRDQRTDATGGGTTCIFLFSDSYFSWSANIYNLPYICKYVHCTIVCCKSIWSCLRKWRVRTQDPMMDEKSYSKKTLRNIYKISFSFFVPFRGSLLAPSFHYVLIWHAIIFSNEISLYLTKKRRVRRWFRIRWKSW